MNTQSESCRFCEDADTIVTNGFCTDCYLHMCENCFTVRNNMNEFLKIKIEPDANDLSVNYMKICHDFCVFRCHKCKTFDDQSEMFLNDNVNLKTVCTDCFLILDKQEQKLYQTPKNNQNL